MKRNFKMEYPRRLGSAVNIKGPKYERHLPAMLVLRLALSEKVEDFWIASNIDHVGDFDDVVIWIKPKNGDEMVCLLQLKHQDKENSSKFLEKKDLLHPKGQFSLEKHCRNSLNFLDKEYIIDSQIIQDLKISEKPYLIFYSNKKLSADDWPFLKTSSNEKESNNENDLLGLLNSNSTDSWYDFDCNHSLLSEYEPDFLKKLHLFVDQIHADKVEKRICSDILAKLQLNSMAGLDQAVKEYIEFIANVIDGYKIGDDTKYYVLTKRHLQNSLVGFLLNPYKLDFTKTTLSINYERPEQSIWNELMNSNKIILIEKTDDRISKFLLDYYGNELQKIITEPPELWHTDLSDLSQKDIYSKFKPSEIAEVCQNGKLNMNLFYKFMWTNGNVPLLLQLSKDENQHEHYQVITKILCMFQHDIRVVVLFKNSSNILWPITNINCFRFLQDLSTENQTKILDLRVRFQGRANVPLKKLLKETMFGLIKCHDIINILSGNYNIGNKYSLLNDDFINRSVPKILLGLDVLKINEHFVIESVNLEATKKNLKEYVTDKCDIVSPSKSPGHLQSLTGIVHRLIYNDQNLEWKESTGSTSSLRKFQLSSDQLHKPLTIKDVGSFLDCNFKNKIRLIGACPGMGKSVFLDFLALHAPWNLWTIKVNLRELRFTDDILENPNNDNEFQNNPLNYLRSYVKSSLENETSKISLAIFERYLNANKLLILLDGFDEIAHSYYEIIIDVVKKLQEKQIMVWITTREHIQETLEDDLNVCALTLQPFTHDELDHYLKTYFKAKICNPQRYSIIEEFVNQLLISVDTHISDFNFIGVALQTKLISDVFLEDCEKFCNTQPIDREVMLEFDILKLYEKYIALKNKIMYEKYGNFSATFCLKNIKEVHYFLALQYIFDSSELKNLEIDKKVKCYYQALQEQLLTTDGILTVRKNSMGLNLIFTHSTFAEYLAAEYLFKNHKDPNVCKLIYDSLRFDSPASILVYNIFDIMSSKKFPLHLDIINLKFDDIFHRLTTDHKSLAETNDLQRSGLHMLAIYGTQLSASTGSSLLFNVTILIPYDGIEILELRDCFNLTAFDYCFRYYNSLLATGIGRIARNLSICEDPSTKWYLDHFREVVSSRELSVNTFLNSHHVWGEPLLKGWREHCLYQLIISWRMLRPELSESQSNCLMKIGGKRAKCIYAELMGETTTVKI